jgi:hypothetical protein
MFLKSATLLLLVALAMAIKSSPLYPVYEYDIVDLGCFSSPSVVPD